MDKLALGYISRESVSYIFLGAVLGFIGGRAVSWLRMQNESSYHPGCFQVINLTDKGPVVNTVSLSGFRSAVSIGDLNQLRESVGWKPRTEKMWQEVFTKSTHIVCMKKDNQLIGYGSFVGNGRMGTIFDIHIHPKCQRQGLGILLLNQLVAKIKTLDYAFIGLFGWKENQGVLKFYEKFGFHANPYAMESSSKELKSSLVASLKHPKESA